MSTTEVKRAGRLSREGQGVWTKTEHERFLEARRVYPNGPWKLVAEYIGTRSTRQTMTHAQKYRQKLERRMRGLRSNYRKNKNQSQNASNDVGAQDDGNSSSSDEQRSGDEGSAYDDDMDMPFDIVVDVNSSNAASDALYKTIEGSSPHSVSYTSLLTNILDLPTSDGPLAVAAAAYDDYYNVLSEITDEDAVLAHHASNSTDLPWVDDYLDYIVQQFA